MQTKTTQPRLSINSIKRAAAEIFKSLFESPDKREFQRLKDFIAS
jgi:hypothetical protein